MPINSTFILVMLVIAGYVYCYFAITSRNNTILELNGKIAEQQLNIEQATITKQKQQEIMNDTVKQIQTSKKATSKTIEVIEKQIILPGCDNSIKYLKDEAEKISW